MSTLSRRSARQRKPNAARGGDPALRAMLATARQCLAAGESVPARVVLDEIRRRDPAQPEAARLLAGMLCDAGDPGAAEAVLRESLEHAAGARSRELRLALGELLTDRGRAAGALLEYERLLAVAPGDAAALNGRGLALLATGELAAAARCFEAAFEADPLLPGVALNLARSRRFDGGERDARLTEGLHRVARRRGLPDWQRADALFAAGKAEDDRGRHAGAMRCWKEANALMRPLLAFDAAAHRLAVERLLASFDADLFRRLEGAGAASEKPLFVVGLPRSGTTLVEQMLAMHPQVHAAGELPVLDALARGLRARTGAALPYPRCAAALAPEHCRALGDDYLARLPDAARELVRCTDKLPANFMHLGLAAVALPGARVVHCRRHPLDVAVSVYAQQFAHGHAWAYDAEDIAAFIAAYQRVMAHWQAVLPLPVLDLRYESLVGFPRDTLARLLAHCGLPFDEACLQFHRARREVDTASNWQVRQPLYAGSVARRHRYGDALEPLARALRAHGVELDDG